MAIPVVNFQPSAAPFDLTGALMKAMQARYQGALANKENTLLPEELRKAQLENKYYGSKMEADIGLEGAQTQEAKINALLNRRKYDYPGLGEGGVPGEIGMSLYLANNPAVMQALTSYMTKNSGQSTLPGQTGAAISQPAPTPTAPQTPYGQYANTMTLTPEAQQRQAQSQQIASALAPIVSQQVQQPQPTPLSSTMNQPQQVPTEQIPDAIKLLLSDVKSQADARQALAENRTTGSAKYDPVQKKNLDALKNQIALDNPDWSSDPVKLNEAANAYVSGADEYDGVPLSANGNALLQQIYNKNSTSQIRNQAAQYDMLYQDMKDVDIDRISKFAGPSGKIDIVNERRKMITDPDSVSDDAREYLAFQDKSILIMDSLRKAFGTSIQKSYVQGTLGRLSDPTNDIWKDPKQVQKGWNMLLDWVDKNKDILSDKSKRGNVNRSQDERKSEKSDKSDKDEVTKDNGVKMYDEKGNKVLVHPEDVDEAIKAGYTKR